MNWSSEQSAIFNFFASGTGNMVVRARAGTGKTTTIKEAFNHAPEARILYAVFNKKNQKEAEAKIQDPRVEVKTLHSLGFAFIKRVWSNAKPDDEVETDRAMQACGSFFHLRNDKEFVAAVCRLVGFLKNTKLNPTAADARDVAESEDILSGESQRDEELIHSALRVLEISKTPDKQGRISFNDMVWLPVAMNWVRPWYNLVCIDEAQDMNLPQLMMARAASSGRVVVVGDDRQAIYGFRGAVQDGMGMMKVTLRASTLGLTTTYRCPKAVVRIAAEIVPDYKAADSAPEGEVNTISDVEKHVQIGDAILSRLNAPLMPLALSLLRKNIPARIEGRDIGRQLIGMVRTMKAKSVPHFIERVEAWLAKQIERLQRSKGADKKIEQSRDISETLKALAMDCKNVVEIEQRITNLFQDSDSNSKPAVVLSSVHKAKGLEWPRVFLLSDTFRQKSGTGEEANIYYVAVTRAQQALYFVGGSMPQAKPEAAVKPAQPEARQVSEATPQSLKSLAKPQKISRAARIAQLEKEGKDYGRILEIIRKEYPAAEVVLPEIPKSSRVDDNDWDAVSGMVRIQPGDVVVKDGKEFVCHAVSDSGSELVCLKRESRTVTDRVSGKESSFLSAPEKIKVNKFCKPGDIVRRVPAEEVNNFLSRKDRARKESNNKTSGTESETDMSKAKKDTKKTATPKAVAKSATKKEQVSYAGRGERIAELVAAKKTDNQILEIIKSEFPGSSTSPVLKTIASKKARAAKGNAESAKPAKAEKKPVVKKPSKKAARVSEQVEAEAQAVESAAEAPKMTPPPRPGTEQE